MKRELQYEVTEEEDGLRLDQYIAGRCMDLSRSYIQKLIKESRVTINKNIQTKTKTAVQESDIVNVSLPDPKELEIKPQDIPLDILYEDNDVLVVNKPKGMVVHPAPGHMKIHWSMRFCTIAVTICPESMVCCGRESFIVSTKIRQEH